MIPPRVNHVPERCQRCPRSVHIFNEDSGLYTVRFRTYSPTLGRWLERDPAGYVDGMGLYEYVRGGPIAAVDPWGLQIAPVRGVRPPRTPRDDVRLPPVPYPHMPRPGYPLHARPWEQGIPYWEWERPGWRDGFQMPGRPDSTAPVPVNPFPAMRPDGGSYHDEPASIPWTG